MRPSPVFANPAFALGVLLGVQSAAAQAPDRSAPPEPQVTGQTGSITPDAPSPDDSEPDSANAPPTMTPPTSATPAIAPPSDTASETCQDTWPSDRTRPRLVETFPKRGLSGHVARLEIEVHHLPGEVVFPAGLSFSPDASEVAALSAADFVVPQPDSDVRPTLKTTSEGDSRGDEQKDDEAPSTTTQVVLPLILLPKEAGRHELTLPRFPISIARASGQVHTLCTDPHVIVVEDPLASTAEPKMMPDPEPRVQLEVWNSLRDVVLTLAWAVPAALLAGWLFVKYGSKLKKAPPPPPPIPPWQTAREQIAALRARKLLDAEKFEEQLDEICDILRRYLGARYGFDGLECTTRELLRALSLRAPDFPEEQSVRTILQRADLVKFARRAPSLEECEEALSSTEHIIERTRPLHTLDPRNGVKTEERAHE